MTGDDKKLRLVETVGDLVGMIWGNIDTATQDDRADLNIAEAELIVCSDLLMAVLDSDRLSDDMRSAAYEALRRLLQAATIIGNRPSTSATSRKHFGKDQTSEANKARGANKEIVDSLIACYLDQPEKQARHEVNAVLLRLGLRPINKTSHYQKRKEKKCSDQSAL